MANALATYTSNDRAQPVIFGGIDPDRSINGAVKLAYEVTDWFEMGTYLPIYSLTGDGRFLADGVQLRGLFAHRMPANEESTMVLNLS